MKNKTNDSTGNKLPEQKKSWIERNLWLVAVGIAIFILRMCNYLSR